MPRQCTICTHPDRKQIEQALVSGRSLRNVAEQYGCSATALHRHKQGHLPSSLTQAKQAQEIARADSVLEEIRAEIRRIRKLYRKAEAILDQAQDQPIALKSVRELSRLHKEMRDTLELLARISGELEQRPANTAVVIVPEQLPPGAPCHLDKEYWIERGFTGPMGLLEGQGKVIDAEAE